LTPVTRACGGTTSVCRIDTFLPTHHTESQQKSRILIARINAFIAEHISGIGVVQAFCRGETSLARFDEINQQNMIVSKQWVTANAWFLPSIEFCGAVSQVGLLLAGGYLLHGGTVTVGTLVAFCNMEHAFYDP
jgi:ATP-binding cassette subfamily B multidrug efflux pump